jgi:hypothetical protein
MPGILRFFDRPHPDRQKNQRTIEPSTPVKPAVEVTQPSKEVEEYCDKLVDPLRERDVTISPQRLATLLKKLQHYQSLHHKQLPPSISSLADAIAAKEEAFFTKNLGIARVLELHQEANIVAARQAIKDTNPQELTVPEVILTSGGYQLVALTTRAQLQNETACMGHCVGDDKGHGDHYYHEIATGNIELFSFREDNQILATIEYDRHNHVVKQIKLQDDEQLKGCEPFFHTLLSLLQQLPQTLDSQGRKRLVKHIDDLDIVLIPEGSFLSGAGRLLKISELTERADIYPQTINHPEALTTEQFRIISTIPNITLDATNMPQSRKNTITEFAGMIVDHQGGQVTYTSLTTCRSLRFIGQRLSLPVLREAHYIFIDHTHRLDIPALEKVQKLDVNSYDMDLSAPCLREASTVYSPCRSLSLPQLKNVSSLVAESCRSVYLPKLQEALFIVVDGSDQLDLSALNKVASLSVEAERLELPQLTTVVYHKDYPAQISAPRATFISLPVLSDTEQKLVFAFARATTFWAPQLQQVYELNLPQAHSVNLFRLQNVEGNLVLNALEQVDLPSLQSAFHIEIKSAHTANLPALRSFATLMANSLERLFLPQATTASVIAAPHTQNVDLPQMTEIIIRLGVNSKTKVAAPQLLPKYQKNIQATNIDQLELVRPTV